MECNDEKNLMIAGAVILAVIAFSAIKEKQS